MHSMIGLINYGLVALFGIVLSAEFCGVPKKKRTLSKLVVFASLILIEQALCWKFLGLERTKMLYPFITHLPLTILLVIGFHQRIQTAVVSVLSAYLCCQIPRWIADTAYHFSDDKLYRNLLYILATIIIYLLLHHYVVKPTQSLLSRSKQTTLALGIFPLLYYIFDYIATVYTDLLYSGNPFAVQFMPSVMAVSYFFLLPIYHSIIERQEKSQRERDLLAMQLRHAEAEFSAMRQMQEQARQYRHDLRHHFSLLLSFAETGELQKIKDYLCTAQRNLDAFTPKHFCGNDVIDLLLSHFAVQAKHVNVTLSVDVRLPPTLPFKDTELCSLLSNGLENALLAAKSISDASERIVSVQLRLRQKNLLLSIENPYAGEVTFVEGMPVTKRKEHGFGTRNIASIVKRHGGQVSFSAENHIFRLRVILPLNE